jgi:hypothetical protein
MGGQRGDQFIALQARLYGHFGSGPAKKVGPFRSQFVSNQDSCGHRGIVVGRIIRKSAVQSRIRCFQPVCLAA